MTNNSTKVFASADERGWEFLWYFVATLIQGLVVGGSNLFIVLVILRFKALRQAKEYLVIMSLSLADGIHMIGFIAAGR